MRLALHPKNSHGKSGLLFVKENYARVDKKVVEKIYGKTRSVASLIRIFTQAGFEVLHSARDEFC